ncbi:hypothetical protein BDDG_02321 [Blastomyces dermatitidis ATCC 18188]|uniref:NmrA-like domain-containing protein n=1 Tax=Ajellomyces dermatitidis (strain ATCC 18188 / CBS 674.68) TaxID=653446 RepID=F2T819_AJEDA|nr:hypothetical protein BDDG_02321 [Blastomyces dermatitidis ATCC 18188]
MSMLTQPQVGRALVAILEHPSATANQYVYVSSYTVTASEMVTVLEKATGSKWNARKIDPKQTLSEANEKLEWKGVG